MIRVLLIDDHPVVRTGYKRLLLQEPGLEVVAEASNADEGYQAFQAHLPDVTVTDVSMPGAGGLSLLQKILQQLLSMGHHRSELVAIELAAIFA